MEPQNWAITQDDRGVIYVGSKRGISAYDGETWDLVISLKSTVRSLATGSQGFLFVGLKGDFGYLHTTPDGSAVFTSIARQYADILPSFSDVWSTHI
ncbi:MAG: hypothetical protein KJO98_11685, partial [Rhodothermia bacterium]|nr:hypothetical protein [Rhodothermia bacterium]